MTCFTRLCYCIACYSQNHLRFYAAALPLLRAPRRDPPPASRSTTNRERSSSGGTSSAGTRGVWGSRGPSAPVCCLSPEPDSRSSSLRSRRLRQRRACLLQKAPEWSSISSAAMTKTPGPAVSFSSWTSTSRTPSWCPPRHLRLRGAPSPASDWATAWFSPGNSSTSSAGRTWTPGPGRSLRVLVIFAPWCQCSSHPAWAQSVAGSDGCHSRVAAAAAACVRFSR